MNARCSRWLFPLAAMLVFSACGDEDGIDTAPSDDGPVLVPPTPRSSEERTEPRSSGPASTDTGRVSDPSASTPPNTSEPASEPPSSASAPDPDPSESAPPGTESTPDPDPSGATSTDPDPSEPPSSDDPPDPPGEAAMPCDEARPCADDLLCIRLSATHEVGFCAPTCSTLHTPCGWFGPGVHAECSLELPDGTLACGFICELNHGDHVHNYTCPDGDWGRLRCERTRRAFNHRFCAPSQN